MAARPPPKSAEELKELFIQRAERDWPTSLESKGLVKDMDPSELETWFSFNPDTEGPTATFETFSAESIWDNLDKEWKREKFLDKEWDRFSSTASAALQVQVNALMAQELRGKRVSEEDISAWNIQTKAKSIAILRSNATLYRPTQANSTSNSEFSVFLCYLNGGHGANTTFRRLYFPFNTSFWNFCDTLHDFTILCTIPPIDHSSSMLGEYHPNELLKTKFHRVKRKTGDKGYTLDDGPWVWRLAGTPCHPPDKSKGVWHKLSDEADFERMRNELVAFKEEDPSKPGALFVMHIQDMIATDQWRCSQAESTQTEREFRDDY